MRKKSYLARFGRIIGQHEKVILAMLSVVIVISGTVWFKQFSQGRGNGPATGGSYVEGIVGGTDDVQQIATRLTKVGLLGFDQSGKLKNVLVESWQVNPEKTQYTFTLKRAIDKNEILTVLQNNVELLGPSSIAKSDNGSVSIGLETPNPNLPLILSQPLFDYGPYKLGKATDKTTIFSRNPREGSVEPYINKIVIHTYRSKELLQQAIDKGKLDGAANVEVTLPDSYSLQTFDLPRYYTVVFNLNKSPFRETALRKSLIEQTASPNTPFTLTVSDQQPIKSIGAELVTRWRAQGASVTLDIKPAEEISESVSPSRNFQALLTGINYGTELDPYYLWHSSQIRPPSNNLSGLRSDVVDQHIETVRATHDIAERQKRIGALHETLSRQSIALFLRQETSSFVSSDRIAFQSPWMAQNIVDRFRSIASWFVE